MVIILSFGGLGNQMFQYAFSLQFLQQGKVVKLDTSPFNNTPYHQGFELEHVFPNAKINYAIPKDLFHFVESYLDENKQRQYKIRKTCTLVNEHGEMEFTYKKELKLLDDAYFIGYWQHRKYFNSYSEILRDRFSFKKLKKDDINYSILREIQHVNSVSIHIRRGDYLQSSIHRALSLDYYRQAISLIQSQVSAPIFFLFSDDKDFAKQHFNGNNIIIVSHNKGANSFRDMQLMSLCRHNIIANSTFSWWAAWLNANPKKIVVTPDKWFTREKDVSGLLLQGWKKIKI